MDQEASRGDWKVLAKYGWAMFGVQLWELSLKQLVQLGQPDLPDDAPFEDAWREVERLLRRPAGRLREELDRQGYGSVDLHEKLKVYKRRRNELAHEFLLDYVLMQQSGVPDAPAAAVKVLEARGLEFREFGDELGELSGRRAEQRGWDLEGDFEEAGLTPEELGRIILAEEADQDDAPGTAS